MNWIKNLSNLRQKVDRIETKLKSLGPKGMIVYSRYNKVTDIKQKYRRYKKAYPILKEEILLDEKYKERPVSIEEFIKSPDYINHSEIVYPLVMDEIKELNSGKYIEAVLTGGIGTGKTFIGIVTTAYQLYVLSCLRNPQKEMGLSPNDEIVFIFQSLNATHARSVDFMRFKNLIKNSKYFQENFNFDKNIESELQFPHRIIVRPVSGAASAAIGQNVIGGVIDEINFMKVIEDSKHAVNGGEYNQAWEVYRSIKNRRQSRFMKQGSMPGMLCLVSSKQYPGEFTDVKIEEAKTDKGIFVYDKRVWEVKPKETFTGKWFRVFTGDEVRKPAIISKDQYKRLSKRDRLLTMLIPSEFKQSFKDDILSALREIAGISTRALSPFIFDIEKMAKCFGRVKSILSSDDVDFVETQIEIYPNNFRNLSAQRFVHIDLAKTGDSAGVACGYVEKFVAMKRGDTIEIMPQIKFDFVLEVKPPRGGEINFEKIRTLLYTLRDAGLPIKWVSFDTFQSVDMIQILRSKKFRTGTQSMDTDMDAYDLTKAAFMDDRLLLPTHAKCYTEFTGLEKNIQKGKIDHRPNGSKDCSDAVAGVVAGLTLRREIWQQHRISIQQIPESVKGKAKSSKSGIDNQNGEESIAK